MATPHIEATVSDVGHDGKGVVRVDGKAVFVSGVLQGERVRLRIRKRHRHYDEAELVEVLQASPQRVQPRCAHFGSCGGCSLQHMTTQAQMAAKQRVLADNLQRIGRVTPRTWLAPLTAAPWSYRRRGRLSVRRVAKNGRVLVGFREADNLRLVADIQHCEVAHPALGPNIGLLGGLVSGMDAADAIAQIEFAAGDDTLALVFRHLQPLGERDRLALVRFGQTHGFAIYLQPGCNSSVHPLWPEAPVLQFTVAGRSLDEAVNLQFEPLDFVQVNVSINQQMVGRALDLLDPQPGDRVLDLFCGLGNFTLPLARRVAQATGVDGEHALVERAAANAARNGIGNACFYVANLFEDQRHAAWAKAPYDTLLLDPPRAGADQVLEYLPHAATGRVVYVSCHPASLARDAAILAGKGFELVSAGVMDMFPHTAHVESIALFERR